MVIFCVLPTEATHHIIKMGACTTLRIFAVESHASVLYDKKQMVDYIIPLFLIYDLQNHETRTVFVSLLLLHVSNGLLLINILG